MRVKALATCFVGAYRMEGDEFDYDGPPNSNLKPLGGRWPSKPSQNTPPPPPDTGPVTGPETGSDTGLSESLEPVNR